MALQWFLRFGMPVLFPDTLEFAVFAGLFGGLAVIVWWAFFSRAVWPERVGAIVLMALGLMLTSKFVHASVATGMMGLMLPIFGIPVLCLAWVMWAAATRHLAGWSRWSTMVAAVVLGCGLFTLVRTNGISPGAVGSDLKWRWSDTAEARMLARPVEPPAAPVAVPAVVKAPEPVAAVVPKVVVARNWAGFRGAGRNSVVSGVAIETDWTKSPPVVMWRQPVGPGWSSFAVNGDLLYTQEQRGSEELVACYNVTTGKPVWRHTDAARFWESNAGAGPRATPALHNGRVYTFGGTGILNALDALNGGVVWRRDVSADSGVKVPEWGFASSPLIVDDLVVVAAAGKLAAYDIATGEPRWSGPDGRYGYSSPHFLTIDGVPQIVLASKPGLTSFAVADGAQLWEHALPVGMRIVQPAVLADGDLLAGEGEGHNIHRVKVSHAADGAWTTEERWSSNGLKPYFSDFVIHNGHAYGVDGSILSCIDLKDGKRAWKGGRYGSGQIVLLPAQNLLLVLSDEGELALVSATPDKFTEVARMPAVQGKTWNHPVLVGDVLLVRNSEEMAAFRLTLAQR